MDNAENEKIGNERIVIDLATLEHAMQEKGVIVDQQ